MSAAIDNSRMPQPTSPATPDRATEFPIDAASSLVAKTDLKGRITYMNGAFAEAAGYSETELLGKELGFLRHPDTPVEVFRDLWVTLSEGISWTGMVKKRRKSGEYFWVLMTVTPLRNKPPTVGFLVVCTKPTPQQIQDAERVYRAFKESNHSGYKIRHGMVEQGGLAGLLTVLRSIPIHLRIQITTIAAALLMIVIGLLGGWEMTASGQHSGLLHWLPNALALAGVSGGILLLLFGYFISRTILTPINHALEVAHAISWGDLSPRFDIDPADETAQLMLTLNQMKTNLVAVVLDAGQLVANIKALSAAASRATDPGLAQDTSEKPMESLNSAIRNLETQADKLAEVLSVFKAGGR